MTSPTSWTLYASNEEAWEAMLADCAAATESIVLEQFIFVADGFGQKLIDICAERAKAGVKVRFLWDAAGSFTLWGSNIAADLKKQSIELVFWKTLIPGYYKVPNFRSWYLRNHRRTLVIDGKIGYTGSICVRDGMKSWRDTNVRLEGPVVREMTSAFERMWARALGHKPLPPRIKARDHEFRYVTSYPAPGRRHIYTSLVEAIRHARRYIYITTPYFVPTPRLIRVIKLAAHRGVDVRLIVPEKSDFYAVDLGARSYFETLLKSGVRIFTYSNTMIHSKTVVIDGSWSTVGTLNLDRQSLLYNYEANIITGNSRFAEELAAHFVHDMHKSKEILYGQWRDRFFIERLPEIAIRPLRIFL
jgi:cardiolipin synthase